MKNILVIGATGQIGSELTMKLRGIYGNNHVVCGYIPSAAPKGELAESGPAEICDVTNSEMIAEVVLKHKVDTIYNLAALLSVVAEGRPQLAWKIGIDGLWNVLEVAREHECAVFTPSSIGSFGPETPPTMCRKTQFSVHAPSMVCRRLPPNCSLTTITASMVLTHAPYVSPV